MEGIQDPHLFRVCHPGTRIPLKYIYIYIYFWGGVHIYIYTYISTLDFRSVNHDFHSTAPLSRIKVFQKSVEASTLFVPRLWCRKWVGGAFIHWLLNEWFNKWYEYVYIYMHYNLYKYIYIYVSIYMNYLLCESWAAFVVSLVSTTSNITGIRNSN